MFAVYDLNHAVALRSPSRVLSGSSRLSLQDAKAHSSHPPLRICGVQATPDAIHICVDSQEYLSHRTFPVFTVCTLTAPPSRTSLPPTHLADPTPQQPSSAAPSSSPPRAPALSHSHSHPRHTGPDTPAPRRDYTRSPPAPRASCTPAPRPSTPCP